MGIKEREKEIGRKRGREMGRENQHMSYLGCVSDIAKHWHIEIYPAIDIVLKKREIGIDRKIEI